MAKLEIALLVGDESKKFLQELTNQLDRLEKLSSKKKADEEVEDDLRLDTNASSEPEEADDDEDEDFAPKKKAKAKTKDFDEDEEEDETSGESEESDGDDEDSEEDEEPAPKKKTKEKKLTEDDINDAAKAHAGVKGRKATLALMLKKFKTQSVSDIKPEEYAKFIATLKKDVE